MKTLAQPHPIGNPAEYPPLGLYGEFFDGCVFCGVAGVALKYGSSPTGPGVSFPACAPCIAAHGLTVQPIEEEAQAAA